MEAACRKVREDPRTSSDVLCQRTVGLPRGLFGRAPRRLRRAPAGVTGAWGITFRSLFSFLTFFPRRP